MESATTSRLFPGRFFVSTVVALKLVRLDSNGSVMSELQKWMLSRKKPSEVALESLCVFFQLLFARATEPDGAAFVLLFALSCLLSGSC